MSCSRTYIESSDRVVIRVSLENESHSELSEGAAWVVRTAAFPGKMLRRPSANLDDLDRAFTDTYEFVFDIDDGAGKKRELTERQFFERCIKHQDIHPLMRRYISFVQGKHQDLGVNYLRHEVLYPAGCFALAPLVLDDSRYVSLLTTYLLESDSDEENVLTGLIKRACKKHGWNEDTLDLMAVRIATGHGQWVQEELAYAVEFCDLLDHFERNSGYEHFLDVVIRTARSSGLGPSLCLGTIAFVFGRGNHKNWLAWVNRVRGAHDRECVLVEPGPQYSELYEAAAPEEAYINPENWDEIDV